MVDKKPVVSIYKCSDHVTEYYTLDAPYKYHLDTNFDSHSIGDILNNSVDSDNNNDEINYDNLSTVPNSDED